MTDETPASPGDDPNVSPMPRWVELQPDAGIAAALDYAGARPEAGSQHEKRHWSELFAHACALAFANGLRGCLDHSIPPLRRRADVAFTRWHVAVFFDGCFWHGCPLHGTIPKSNREWWTSKLRANVERDRDTDAALTSLGWRVVRIWEHETIADGVARVVDVLRAAGRPEQERAPRVSSDLAEQ